MTWHADSDSDTFTNNIPDEIGFEVEDAEEEEELDFFHPDYRKLDAGEDEES